MTYLDATQVSGHEHRLTRTDPRHVRGTLDAPEEPQAPQGFSQMLMGALDGVNTLQQEHDQLSVQAVLDPESVNSHDVTIAAAKATMSLNITKSVVDAVLQAYREIMRVS